MLPLPISRVTTTADVRRAWLWATYYFVICLMVAATAGVAPYLINNPLVLPLQLGDPLWYVFALVCLVVVVVTFWVILPRGTLTHERKLSLPSVLLFGILWGVCQGFLFLAVWTVILRLTHSVVWGTVFAFVVIAAFLYVWHRHFWDVFIAPEHIAPGWETRQFVLCYIPMLVVTLAFLGMYSNGLLFVLFQTIALLGASFFMRIQPFWRGV